MPKFFLHRNIDRKRWDAAVSSDASGLPYGYSWWLDAVTEGRWNGLVADDYSVVLPLPVRRSFGRLTQVQRGAFTQQSGPFGELKDGDLQQFLSALPRSIVSLNIPLSEDSRAEDIPSSFNIRQRTNLVLPLDADYPTLLSGFSKTLRKKLRRNPGGRVVDVSPETVIEIYKASSGQKAGLQPHHYATVLRLIHASLANNSGHLYGFEDDTGLLAAGFFPHHNGRVINLFAGTTPAGFKQAGMARLLAAIIQKHQGPGNLFDFEGSDILGVGNFFRSFGSVEREYLAVERQVFRF
jgi:hypothetical protein